MKVGRANEDLVEDLDCGALKDLEIPVILYDEKADFSGRAGRAGRWSGIGSAGVYC